MLQKKRLYLILGIINYAVAVKPPGYIEKPKVHDENPPKYEYGYTVTNDDAGSQGHAETRDGDNTKGNYYVNLPSGQSQADVRYIADDWGYHPLVRYATNNGHSQTSGHFALGESAVQALQETNSKPELIPNNIGQNVPKTNPPIVQIFPQNINNEKVTFMYPISNPDQLDYNVVTNVSGDNNIPNGISKLVNYTQDLVSNRDVYDINKAAELVQNNLFQTASLNDQQNAASIGQKQSVELENQKDIDKPTAFLQPIVVLDENSDNTILSPADETPIEVKIVPLEQQYRDKFTDKPLQQINVQILNTDNNQQMNFPQNLISDSMPLPQTEAPSRQFLKRLKNFKLSPSADVNQIYSTTTSTDQTVTTSAYSPTNFDVTPRPISNSFLAPIQAGLRLSSNPDKNLDDCIENHDKSYHVTESPGQYQQNQKTLVEVKKDVNLKNILISQEQVDTNNLIGDTTFGARFVPKQKSISNVDLKNSFGVQIKSNENQVIPNAHFNSQQIDQSANKKEIPFEIEKQILIPYTIGRNVDATIQQTNHIDRSFPVTKAKEQKIPAPYVVEKIVEKYIDRPYPVENRVNVPYPVEKIVEKKVPVERLVEKIIDRPVPYPVEVEKIVHKPYAIEKIIEKIVDRPVQIEKIVEKEVKVPYPVKQIVEKIIDRPIEIEKIVEKPVPFPYPIEVQKIVEKPYPVEKIIEKPIHIPYPVEKIIDRPVQIEKIIEKKVEVPIDRIIEKIVNVPVHIPVEKIVDRPYPIETIVEKFIDRPYPIQVQVPVPVHIPYAVHVPVHIPYHVPKELSYGIPYGPPKAHHAIIKENSKHKTTKHVYVPNSSNYHFAHSTATGSKYSNSPYHSTIDCSFPTRSTILHPVQTSINNIHSHQPKPVYGVPFANDESHAGSSQYHVYANSFGYNDDYLGPPPLKGVSYWTYEKPQVATKSRKNLNFGKSLRWEYGFKPPLKPSIEIDEHGNPINNYKNIF